MDSSQMHATLGLHVNKLDVKTIGAIHRRSVSGQTAGSVSESDMRSWLCA